MKGILLFAMIVATSTFCSAQMQRAFYNYETANFARTEILAEINNQLVFASIKDQSQDTITVVTGYLDNKGETSNYQSVTIPNVLTGSVFEISGYGVNANNELILAIQGYVDGTTTSTMTYIRINPMSNQVPPIYINPTQMKRGYVRARQNGDSLVTYFSNSANEFKRVATSLNNISNYSLSTISTGVTYSGGMIGKKVELLVTNNGTEYVSVSERIFKRIPSNVVISTNLAGLSNIYGISLCINSNSNDELFILHRTSYVQLTAALNLVTSGNISGLASGGPSNVEMYYENGKYMILNPTFSNSYNPFVVNASTYAIESSTVYNNSIYRPCDVLTTSNGHYFIGIKAAGNGYSTFVSKLEIGVEPEPYIDYGQNLYNTNLKVNTNHLGKFFNNDNTSAGFFTKHEGQYKGLIYAASNSIIGLDNSNDTVGFYDTYATPKMYPGPFLPKSNRTIQIIDKYNRGYAVDKAMIDNHVTQISYGNPSYEIPFGIKQWPGNGNVAIGQASTILPFNDHNNNGIYEPELGDYPLIYGDKCVVNVFHQGEEANDVGLECHQYLYSFDCDTSELIRNTIFVNQRFIARTSDLNNAYIGTFLDTDIGSPNDDLGGTNVELGMIYSHNGDYYDESVNGNPGFNAAIPAIGMQLLRGPKLAADLQDNNIGIGVNESINGFGFADGIVDNEYLTLESSRVLDNGGSGPYLAADPNSLREAYSVYQGKYIDGSPVQLAGNTIRFQYFGNSDPLFYASNGVDHGNNYSEITATNPPGDRRVYGGSGPFNLATSNDTIEIVSAYIVAHDTVSASPANFGLDLLFQRGKQLKEQYALNNAGCGKTFGFYDSPNQLGVEEIEITALIYPNPTQSNIIVVTEKSNMQSLQLYSLNGLLVLDQKVEGNSSEIDLSALRSGIYLLKINTDKGTLTKKVSKI